MTPPGSARPSRHAEATRTAGPAARAAAGRQPGRRGRPREAREAPLQGLITAEEFAAGKQRLLGM